MKAQTPWDNPSPVAFSESKHVKNKEMLKRKEQEKQLLAKNKKKIKNSSIKIFLDCFFTRANDYMRQ